MALFCVTEIHSSESGLNTSNQCFQIKIIPQVHTPALFIYFFKGIVYFKIGFYLMTLMRTYDSFFRLW